MYLSFRDYGRDHPGRYGLKGPRLIWPTASFPENKFTQRTLRNLPFLNKPTENIP